MDIYVPVHQIDETLQTWAGNARRCSHNKQLLKDFQLFEMRGLRTPICSLQSAFLATGSHQFLLA